MKARPIFCDPCSYRFTCQGGCKAAAEVCYGDICHVCGEEATGILMEETLDEVVLLYVYDDCNLNCQRGLNEEGEDE